MKTLSALTRVKSSIENTCRRNYGNANIQKRKDLRRLKRINIYNKELSGQSNPNSWFTPKKMKAMGNHIQTMKNNHVGSNAVTLQMQQELLKVMPALSDYQYFNFRNRNQQLIDYKQLVESRNVENFINLMPAKLRKQVMASELKLLPEIAEPLLKYNEQMQVFLPADEKHRQNLIQKIAHPPKAKLESEEN